MFARNLLQAGDYVTVVPLGLPITLQYSTTGAIEKVYTGHNANDWEDVTDEILTDMLVAKQVPNHVPTSGGVCYVRALAYSSELQFGTGKLPECVMQKYLNAYKKNPNRFTVYAGDVQSPDTAFNGAPVPTRQWLTVNQFKLLPGYVVSSDIDEEKFETMVKKNFQFRYPLIPSYILFRKNGLITYPSTGMSMFSVSRVERYTDQCGNILSHVYESGSDSIHDVSYPQIVHFDIQKNSHVVCNSDGNFIYVQNSERADKLNRKIVCADCGKQLIVPAANVRNFRCDDPQCNSVLYPRVVQMLNTFHLPLMSFERYREVVDEIGPVFLILDVFDIEEYKDLVVTATISDIVRAVVPKEILPGMNQINELCDGCNNSDEVLTYYFQHPDAILSDLGLDTHAYSKFVKWLKNPENCTDCVEIFKVSNINMVSAKPHVNGVPIFRDKKIFITGTFSHGRTDDIISILEGYSATVITKFDQSADCIVIGDVPENINGHAVSTAKMLNIPILEEHSFFTMYGIDDDLRKQ